MSALPQHYLQLGSDKNFSSDLSNTQVLSKSQTKLKNNSQKSPSRFPKPRKFPPYLKILLLLQRGSLGVASFSIATGIMLYLSTVAIPQQWSKEYRNLESLQRQERQLTTIGESLKYKLSQQARQYKMSPIASSNTVFLKPNSVAVNPQKTQENQSESLKKMSLGY
ncbi:MAG: hypothetical protein QNJ55_19195 [Xenococcus sp. MO_188.B8]|nr:hypothetical protein [Xenococcus sp. MO_188.B8]